MKDPSNRWVPKNETDNYFMFIFWKIVFKKLFFKLFYVCLSIENMINEKYFPVNRKHFPVKGKYFLFNKKHFPVKEKFSLVSRKVFFLLVVFVFRKVVFGKPLFKLLCVCLPLEKLVNGKHFPVKGKYGLVFRKVFSWKIWAENTFRKLWKI